ncbi:MAG TPA: hypothetical protein VJJ23_04845 [Candidatus Nanoarchaeia archaeon]|nr:hypothetical protein [uncultured archaeon]HLC56536.1 hypothetical protein [Candidatus Nanoarchaeia archaeon]
MIGVTTLVKKKKENELLKSLDLEEEIILEEFVLPDIKFDIEKKVASIFMGRKSPHIDIAKLLKSDIAESLLIHYTILNLNYDEVNRYLNLKDGNTIPRLILADIASEILGRENYDINNSFNKFKMEMAFDIYQDFFNILNDKKNLDNINHKKRIVNLRENGVSSEDVFMYFRGVGIEQMIAAAKFNQYIHGFEEKLKYVNNIRDLRYLFGIKVYHDLINDKGIKQDINCYIDDNKISLDNIFIYTILQIHNDFLKQFGDTK